LSASDDIRKRILDLVEEYHAATSVEAEPFIPSHPSIPYAGRVFDEAELVNLVDASLDFWLTQGRYSDRFEADLAMFLGLKHAVMVNSGSSANLLAFMALTSPSLGERRIGRGDEVVTVAAGFPTTVAPVVQYGAVPVFVDVTLPTYNADPDRIEEAVSERSRAVFLAHTMGNPADLDRILSICRKHDLWFLEDNCDSLGSLYRGRLTGTFGHLGTSSFYPPHHMTTGEGGAVYTDDSNLSRIVTSMRDWGRDCVCPPGVDDTCGHRFSGQYGDLPPGYDHKYVYSHLGYNLKPTDLQAAIGVAQLVKLPGFIDARRKHWQFLRDALNDLDEFFILPESTEGSEPSWFGFLLTVREGAPFRRNDIVEHLEKGGIQTRALFSGNLIRHPCWAHLEDGSQYRVVGSLTNSDRIMSDTFWVGVYPGLTDNMLQYLAGRIREFCRR
jgi:CDP-6-deoxy-D-xylo-4-hexulose-3-dehydrase